MHLVGYLYEKKVSYVYENQKWHIIWLGLFKFCFCVIEVCAVCIFSYGFINDRVTKWKFVFSWVLGYLVHNEFGEMLKEVIWA
jgi:hypothetical protein